MVKEIWKRSTLVERLEVSNLGNVRNFKDKTSRYTYTHSRGYVHLKYKVNGKSKDVKVHRLIATEFCYKPEGCDVVNHLDGNKANNAADNLEWTTQLENMRHAWKNGLVPSLVGESNGRAVLNEELVHMICRDYEIGVPPKTIISRYKITRNQAIKIKSRLTWKHVTQQYNY